jgi:hypothetical protein
MKIAITIPLNKELFLCELSLCQRAIERGTATHEDRKRHGQLLAILKDPDAMTLIDAQGWGSNRDFHGDL